jgi:hypothetical protein
MNAAAGTHNKGLTIHTQVAADVCRRYDGFGKNAPTNVGGCTVESELP